MKIATRMTYEEANLQTKGNAQRIYTNVANNGSSGYERLVTDVFPQIAIKPKFKVDRSDPVFTIGSCFARNIEMFLNRSGVNCLTSKCTIEDRYYELTGIGARNGALNAYTPHSMLDMINLINRPDRATAGILQVGDDQYFDMMVSGIKQMTRAECEMVRNRILGTYEDLAHARTVIITLGYTESWYDTQDRIYVNRSPGGSLKTARNGSRYSFHNVSATEVLDVLDGIVASIDEQTNGAKVILTVSPVPLHGTYTDRDVISANQYSKCTLLSAAVETACKYANVDYFPSYEMVMNAERSTVWEQDGVHVRSAIVEKVVGTFLSSYLE